MELSVSNLFINGNGFLGVMRTAIVKDYHDIKLNLTFYKILSTDRQLVEMVEKSCSEEHTSADALKLISNEVAYSKLISYNDAEAFSTYLSFITKRDLSQDSKTDQKWIIDVQFAKDVHFFKIVLTSAQTMRLYSQVNSFYSNYLFLSSLMRQYLMQAAEEKTEKEKKVTEYIPVNPEPVKEIVTPQQVIRQRDEFDEIFEMCLTPSIKSSLVHYTFSYFRFFTDKQVNVRTSETNQVQYTFPLLMPGKFGVDESYFASLILANTSVSLNNVIFNIKKILQNLYMNHAKYKEQPMLFMMMCYLLFVYLLRFAYDTNKESYRQFFRRFICNPSIQNSLFNRLIESNFKEFHGKVFFRISNADLADTNGDINLDKITKLSNDFKHLIPISQQDFADKILNETKKEDQKEPLDFKLSCKKVISVANLIENGKRQVSIQNSTLFDPEHTLSVDQGISKEYDFLDYKLQSTNGNRVVTKTYQKILDYVKNPASLLLLADGEIPKEIKNLFEIISKKVLNSSRITKDTIKTSSFYDILLDSIPNPQNFKHTTFLYIIFRIMIPYSYDIYGNDTFEDVFL